MSQVALSRMAVSVGEKLARAAVRGSHRGSDQDERQVFAENCRARSPRTMIQPHPFSNLELGGKMAAMVPAQDWGTTPFGELAARQPT